MQTRTVLILIISLFVIYTECQIAIESPIDPSTVRDVDTFKVNEWQRYIEFHRKKMKPTLDKIKKSQFKLKKSKTKNKKVAPDFILSRTQDGFIVKQLEPGSESKGNGGFEFPLQPALMTNVKYRYDGSVAPYMKLSETNKGVIGKRLEYGFAPNPGVNWKVRSGSSKSILKEKKIKRINENGEINKNAGVNKNFPVGEISLRGTFKILNASESIKENEIAPIEDLSQDDSYETETEQFNTTDNTFEDEDKYYDYNNINAEDDEESDDDSGNWDDSLYNSRKLLK